MINLGLKLLIVSIGFPKEQGGASVYYNHARLSYVAHLCFG